MLLLPLVLCDIWYIMQKSTELVWSYQGTMSKDTQQKRNQLQVRQQILGLFTLQNWE